MQIPTSQLEVPCNHASLCAFYRTRRCFIERAYRGEPQADFMINRNSRRRYWFLQAALCFIWIFPFVRAYHFYISARETYISLSIADSGMDLWFSQCILLCYGISFLVASLLLWLWCRRESTVVGWCVLLAYVIALWVNSTGAEHVIVLFPNLAPFIALVEHLALAIAGLTATFIGWMKTNRARE